MQKKQVAVITGSYYPKMDGVSDYTSHLKEELTTRDIDIVILTSYQAAERVDDPAVLGVVSGWGAGSLLPLVHWIRKQNADLLHIQFAQGSYRFHRAIFFLPILLRLMGWQKPIVTTLHEYGSWDWNPEWIPANIMTSIKNFGQEKNWWDPELGFLPTLSAGIISTNSHTSHLLAQRLPAVTPRIREIPLAANLQIEPTDRSEARRKTRSDFHWQSNTFVISFFGFIHPVKGLETLLKAFHKFHQQVSNSRLLVIGGYKTVALSGEGAENYMDELRKLVRELGLEELVVFTEYIPAYMASIYIQGSDVGVLPFNHGVYLKSGSLLALLSHAVPTIITHHDPPEVNLEGKEITQIIDPKNESQLVKAISRFYENPQLREQYAENARRFSRRFSWDTIAQQHIQLYRDVLSGNQLAVGQQTSPDQE